MMKWLSGEAHKVDYSSGVELHPAPIASGCLSGSTWRQVVSGRRW